MMSSPTSDRSALLADDCQEPGLLTERALRQAPPGHWERHARALRAMFRGGVRAAAARRALVRESEYVETPTDQLTLDLVRLCQAQGFVPREILREMPGGAPVSLLAQRRRTILRGLARRGWDAQELAEVFPLTPAAIRLLVRRPR